MLIWLAPLFVFGLVVFVHELGHFLAAKAFGVYAPRFSIGFGPAIAKWRAGETEYRVGVLPLGGYVRMASRLDEAAASLEGGAEEEVGPDPGAMKPFGPLQVPESRWFESKPLPKRLVIMLAGVTMNLVLGWVINVGLVKTYRHELTPKVSEVTANRPAALAGIQTGDSIVTLGGKPLDSWATFVAVVSRSAGRPVEIGVQRASRRFAVTLVPVSDTLVDSATHQRAIVGRVGIGATSNSSSVGWAEAIRDGSANTADMATLIYTNVKMIATRQASVTELGGPIAIAQTSVQAARIGFEVLLYLIALISINLALLNILPLPILDGGQIVIQVVESARGRPLSDRARENVARIGLAFILLLMLTATFNDLRRVVTHFLAGHAG